jgi:hypothetical protein
VPNFYATTIATPSSSAKAVSSADSSAVHANVVPDARTINASEP